MYFAENPQVAKQYLANAESQKTPEGNAISYIANYGSYKKALEGAKNRLNFMENHSPEQVNFQKETIKALETKNLGGNLYKVDIPDKDIPNMLDWDKPISQQSNLVQNVAKELLVKIKKISPNADLSNMNGQQLYKLYQQYRGNYPDFASEGMNELGIKGIRYLDEGSRDVPKYSGDIAYIHAGNDFKKHNYTLDDALSGMKQAYKNANVKELKDALNEVYGIKPKQTSNFVVFDPKEVKILEKNNKPTRKEVIEQQLDNIENTGLIKSKPTDVSNTFGKGSEKIQYKDSLSEGFINVLVKPDGTASVLGLEVPEKFRGKGIGQKLQSQVLQDFPQMQGQVSSKAAAKNAYKLGRRPVGQPDATLNDVFKAIDENSSINLVSPKMQEQINKK
jgi:predicted GNAT family acetyltransferase